MPPRLRLAPAVLLLALLPADWARAGDREENLARLRSMTRDERARLAKKLDEFDALDRPDRDALRALDARIAALPAEERARYEAVMRRYSLFYQGLSPEEQKAIDSESDLSRKLALIGQARERQKASREALRRHADALQISSLATIRLHILARQLIIYFQLDPKADAVVRAEFARMKDPEERRKLALKINQDRRPLFRNKFRNEEAEFAEADKAVMDDPEFKKLTEKIERDEPKLIDGLLKAATADASKRKGGKAPTRPEIAQGVAKKRRRDLIEKSDEIEVLRRQADSPVDPSHLERFEAAMPIWARESMDALPPDAARRRLKVLYRLVFPPGEEIPAGAAPEPPRPAPGRPNPAPNDGSRPF